MQEEEKITIPGYETIYRNDKTSNSGGILIAVKDTLKTVTMQVNQETEVGQTLWILLNNQKKEKKSRSDTCTTRSCDTTLIKKLTDINQCLTDPPNRCLTDIN